jgi:hypothetical protein
MTQDPRWKEIQKVHQAAALSINELVPALCRVIDSEAWREFVHPMRGVQRYETFGAFCTEVINIRPEAIEAMLAKAYAKDEAEKVRKMIREDIAPMRESRRPTNEEQAHKGDNITLTGRGTDPSYVIARLKRDDPDLAQEVVEGRMSAHAAAVKAGIKKPTATVPVDSPENAIRALLRRFTKMQLIAALTIMEDG